MKQLRLHLLFAVLAIAVCFMGIRDAIGASFKDNRVEVGSEQQFVLSVCGSKESAIAIIDTDATVSHEAANKLFADKSDCNVVPLSFVVGNVIFSAKLKDDRGYGKVVEIHESAEKKMTLYWVTTFRVEHPGRPA